MITSAAMVQISFPGLLLGLALAGAGIVTCVTAPPGDPRTFPSPEDLLILAGIAVTTIATTRTRRRRAPGPDASTRADPPT